MIPSTAPAAPFASGRTQQNTKTGKNKNDIIETQQLAHLYQEINFLQTKSRTMKADNIELKAKINRIREMIDNPDKHPCTSMHTADADKESEKISEQIKILEAKVKAIQDSDLGGHISELEHESIIYTLEIKRQKKLKTEIEANYKASKEQYEEFEKKVKAEGLNDLMKQFNALKQKANEQAKKNEIIRARLNEKDAAVSQPNQGDEEVAKTIKELQDEIAKEESEIAEINNQIKALQSN